MYRSFFFFFVSRILNGLYTQFRGKDYFMKLFRKVSQDGITLSHSGSLRFTYRGNVVTFLLAFVSCRLEECLVHDICSVSSYQMNEEIKSHTVTMAFPSPCSK